MGLRHRFLILCASLLLTFTVCSAAAADSVWSYTLSEDQEATITGYHDLSVKYLTVPETVDGYNVTAIGKESLTELSSLCAVTIPAQVAVVEEGAIPATAAISSYEGTAAETYARGHGLTFRSLSEYDLRDGILDLSEVPSGNIDVSETRITITGPWTKQLKNGSILYHKDWKTGIVLSNVDRQGDTVSADLEALEFLQTVNEYELNTVKLTPDWEHIRLESGVSIVKDAPVAKAGISATTSDGQTYSISKSGSSQSGGVSQEWSIAGTLSANFEATLSADLTL